MRKGNIIHQTLTKEDLNIGYSGDKKEILLITSNIIKKKETGKLHLVFFLWEVLSIENPGLDNCWCPINIHSSIIQSSKPCWKIKVNEFFYAYNFYHLCWTERLQCLLSWVKHCQPWLIFFLLFLSSWFHWLFITLELILLLFFF